MNATATTEPCCTPTAATPTAATSTPTTPAPAGAAPCCGAKPAGQHAGLCCEPEAKEQAVAAGAGCCRRA